MGKPKKETVRKLRGLMILDQGSYIPPDPKPGGYNLCL